MSDQERATCPDCGKDVAVNKDGSLRKHGCTDAAPAPEPEPAESPVEASTPDTPPERPVTAEAEPLLTTTAAPQPLATTTRVQVPRKYCRVPNCGRTPGPNGLCSSHRLHTHLIS